VSDSSSKSAGLRRATAVAYANIALAKYWGKADVRANLPAVPSLSLTLAGLETKTTVEFSATRTADSATLDGEALTARPLDRVIDMLDRVRAAASITEHARVTSVNHFPTAAGLASSASGFAALALAATHAAGLNLSAGELSSLARQSSASAARSLFEGYAALPARAEQAVFIASRDQLPVEMLIAVTESGPKYVGSTEAMLNTEKTSPLYAAWVESAPAMYDRAVRAVLDGDLAALGAVMEQSALTMHATMMAAMPAVIYWAPATLRVMRWLRERRDARGWAAYFTMDAGPHVKVLCHAANANDVAKELSAVTGVREVIRCLPGRDAHLVSGHETDKD
jgi:diphosphomevalonate decarboxylase